MTYDINDGPEAAALRALQGLANSGIAPGTHLLPIASAVIAAVAPLIAKAERERCLAVVATEIDAFKNPSYAGGPVGAFAELFACNQIAAAIRALDSEPKEAGR